MANAKAGKVGVTENVAILDDGGNLKAFSRMDGAPILPSRSRRIRLTQLCSASPRRISKATRRFWPAFPRSGVWRRMAEGFPLRSTEKLSGRSG
jgi:hypothetical protein